MLLGFFEVLDLLFSFIPGNTISLLDLSSQLFPLAGDHIKPVIRELAPLLLYL